MPIFCCMTLYSNLVVYKNPVVALFFKLELSYNFEQFSKPGKFMVN